MKTHRTFPELQTTLVKSCSAVTILIYLLIAVLLVITAVFGAVETVKLLIDAVQAPTSESLNAVVQSILFIIIIATLIDMVRSYVKFGRVLLRPIFIAGITTMVRRLLVDSNVDFINLLGSIIVIAGLSVIMIFMSREERKMMEATKNNENALQSEEYEPEE